MPFTDLTLTEEAFSNVAVPVREGEPMANRLRYCYQLLYTHGFIDRETRNNVRRRLLSVYPHMETERERRRRLMPGPRPNQAVSNDIFP